ncbi:nuclear transport factor 2 family protein [Winogradskyella vincentii]|uniref:Nuclear transport factor 2 family protein n=1 Tax=Winogradskyella vincentii TaxID=2877122 RepID=A0ABS7XZZ1_9FLAO|nr:nuclear transport factor 2 family protein [Winogradskyella vincentii]MCA0153234.1 nuclear transport factor 2 family protein [Winogradskyella vincentii]
MSKEILEDFYTAFNNLDANTMTSLYHDDIVFEDPAFGILKGEKAKALWQMLCESQKGKDFKVVHSNIDSENDIGSAHWEAFYTFSKTGRKVHNKIDANFEFKDGLIVKHTDVFNLYKWARQAMGFKGLLLGGFSFFKSKLNQQTNRLLEKYMNEKKLSR